MPRCIVSMRWYQARESFQNLKWTCLTLSLTVLVVSSRSTVTVNLPELCRCRMFRNPSSRICATGGARSPTKPCMCLLLRAMYRPINLQGRPILIRPPRRFCKGSKPVWRASGPAWATPHTAGEAHTYEHPASRGLCMEQVYRAPETSDVHLRLRARVEALKQF